MKILMVLCNVPDKEIALRIAQALIKGKLAACVNILSPCQSLYHWEGTIQSSQEIPLLIKTTNACYQALEACIIGLHPYSMPEIVAIPITQASSGYLNWVRQSCVMPVVGSVAKSC
ncbi:MAG: divalent-cation tolerance protein CutA [Neisseriales bacterium]|nr:MAG: divalent-cation tolerance protein CutA [Neisseriales bacterium]